MTAAAVAADNTFAPWGYDLSARDVSVKPGDDFFGYANGTWLKQTEIPPDRSNWSMHAMLTERTLGQLRGIFEDSATAPAGSVARKVGDYYTAYLDAQHVEELGAAPLKPLLDAVRAANSREALAALMGRTNKDFEGSFFSVSLEPDQKDPTHYAVVLYQAGLGLPDRAYYLESSFAEKKAAYQQYVATLLALISWTDPDKSAAAIVDIETRIAQASWTKVDQRDVNRTYNPMSIGDLSKFAPGFDWRGFMRASDLGRVDRVIVAENTAFPALASVFASATLDTLKAWQAFHMTDNAATYLSSAFLKAHFAFRRQTIQGQAEMEPRWKYAVRTVGGGDLLSGGESYGCLLWAAGDLYVAKYFPDETRAKAVAMIDTLKTALKARIERVTWLSDVTKAKALEKVKTLTVRIGSGRDKRDYSKLVITADDLLGDARRVGEFEWARVARRPGQQVDRDEWGMTPQTVNDYANAVMNEISFPAAYLQAPLFNPDADPAVNYGAAGLIAHEMTHNFDDQGRKFDARGRLTDWWTPADAMAFESRIKPFGAQYAAYEVLPGLHVNGDLTMGENIADLGGLLIASDAYHAWLDGKPAPLLDGLTGDQRFFLGWAQVWRRKYREEAMRDYIVSNPHSPPGARTVIPLQNIDAWYAAFDVKPGDKLYLAPEDRVKIW